MTKEMITSNLAKVKKIPFIDCTKNGFKCNVYAIDACVDCPIEGAKKHVYGKY